MRCHGFPGRKFRESIRITATGPAVRHPHCEDHLSLGEHTQITFEDVARDLGASDLQWSIWGPADHLRQVLAPPCRCAHLADALAFFVGEQFLSAAPTFLASLSGGFFVPHVLRLRAHHALVVLVDHRTLLGSCGAALTGSDGSRRVGKKSSKGRSLP